MITGHYNLLIQLAGIAALLLSSTALSISHYQAKKKFYCVSRFLYQHSQATRSCYRALMLAHCNENKNVVLRRFSPRYNYYCPKIIKSIQNHGKLSPSLIRQNAGVMWHCKSLSWNKQRLKKEYKAFAKKFCRM